MFMVKISLNLKDSTNLITYFLITVHQAADSA